MGEVPASESEAIFASLISIFCAWDIEDYRVGRQWKVWKCVKSDCRPLVFFLSLNWIEKGQYAGGCAAVKHEGP